MGYAIWYLDGNKQTIPERDKAVSLEIIDFSGQMFGQHPVEEFDMGYFPETMEDLDAGYYVIDLQKYYKDKSENTSPGGNPNDTEEKPIT